MDILLIKLFTAHILGDFFFQPTSWVTEKERKKLRSIKLYYHILIHGALIFLLTWNVNFWASALILMFLHGIIDAAKLSFQNSKTKRYWFFADQILHIFSIVLIWYFAANPNLDFSFLDRPAFWVNLIAILTLSFPTSIIIRVLIAKWTPTTMSSNSGAALQNAGKYIGIMERLLVFAFVYTGHFEAIGFLIAAKSIFRFGDLKEGNDLKLTEYILIGTLLSFGIAILISLLSTSLY